MRVLAERRFGLGGGQATTDFVDTVFVLTSQPTFAELARSADDETVRRLIHGMVVDAIRRADLAR